jgi:hypothetical protein
MIYPAFLLYLSSGSVRTVEDEYGVLTYTNVYNPALPQQYFRCRVP